ncbi:MAG: hypothetical protein NUV45_14990 [Tepidanaerobacteraceae bacterium]|jgi:hypothetical protein|nr:hypothetical protein [Tepidanaerobacteraceae bacterium]
MKNIVREVKPQQHNRQVQKIMIKSDEKSVLVNIRDIILITRGGSVLPLILLKDYAGKTPLCKA